MKTVLLNDGGRELSVRGIPFCVSEDENGCVCPLKERRLTVSGSFAALCFLGMSADHWQSSDWWGPCETQYDASYRLFFGDRIGRIHLTFNDHTEELISVIFGVNAFNYNLFFAPKAHENDDGHAFQAPYDEPFRSDPQARALLDNALMMNENTDETARKATKWVFVYRPREDKVLTEITWEKEDTKRADFVVSAVTGIPAGEKVPENLKSVDRFFFLQKAYYAPVYALKHRLYQYIDEIPAAVELWNGRFDAPDIRFYNAHGLDLFTNVYRVNITDMAYGKLSDDGMPHTSTPGAPNFGNYVGFGTYNTVDSYSSQVWTRDTGRVLIELIYAGYTERVKKAVEQLHPMLYYPSERYHVPHWKRVANVTDWWYNEGLENDGHASIMMAIATLYLRGGADLAWLRENREHLKAAADYYLWQEANPEISGFDGVLYSHSETSTQIPGGHDLYANIISHKAVELYALLFDELGEHDYAQTLRAFADRLMRAIKERFLMNHPVFGSVWTDTLDDCWTYEYKRFAEILLSGDDDTLEAARELPELFERLTRTFRAQQESYDHPYSGRQMGYGQGYLTNAALLLDLPESYTACVRASANLCYHHTDVPYIVPEGVILHGSGKFFYRNSDLGNAVQQAEIVKETRLMLGLNDLNRDGRFTLVPRLPADMTAMEIREYPVRVAGKTVKASWRYERSAFLPIRATDGAVSYSLDWHGEEKPASVRFGPFASADITSSQTIREIKEINGQYYAYVNI